VCCSGAPHFITVALSLQIDGLSSAVCARCLWQSAYHIDYVAADYVRFALKHHRNMRLQKQQATGNYIIPTWRQLKAAKVLRASVHRMYDCWMLLLIETCACAGCVFVLMRKQAMAAGLPHRLPCS